MSAPEMFYGCGNCGETYPAAEQPLDDAGHPVDKCQKCGVPNCMNTLEGDVSVRVWNGCGVDDASDVTDILAEVRRLRALVEAHAAPTSETATGCRCNPSRGIVCAWHLSQQAHAAPVEAPTPATVVEAGTRRSNPPTVAEVKACPYWWHVWTAERTDWAPFHLYVDDDGIVVCSEEMDPASTMGGFWMPCPAPVEVPPQLTGNTEQLPTVEAVPMDAPDAIGPTG